MTAVIASSPPCLQTKREPSFYRQDLPFVITTEPASRRAVTQALESMSDLECLVEQPLAMPLERGLGN